MRLPKRLPTNWLFPPARATLLALTLAAHAQNQAPTSSNTTTQTISGTVLDGTTQQPIFRALVRLSVGNTQRAVLTDSAGNFTFPAAELSTTSLTASKPGYATDNFSAALLPAGLPTEPTTLRLYPEAILSGTVTDPQGTPVAGLSVHAIRIQFIEGLGRQVNPIAYSNTNSRGRFRLLVPAGNYRVESAYTPLHTLSAKPTALMPVIFPEGDGSSQSLIHLAPGEQHQVDLHPALESLVKVVVHGQSPRDLENLNAYTPSGGIIPLRFTPAEGSSSPPDLTAWLPSGTFTVRSSRYFPEGLSLQQATLKVTPSPTSPSPVALQFLTVPSIPIEVTYNPPPPSPNMVIRQSGGNPNAGMVGLHLEPIEWAESNPQSLSRAANGAESFVAPPGTYRLRANPFSGYYVQSATFGESDVLRNPLLVAAGAAPTPLRITLGSQLASVRGLVTLNGAPAAATVCAIPNFPSATPILTTAAKPDGNFTLYTLQPGQYSVFALQHKRAIDPTDPGTYERYAAHAVTLNIDPADPAPSPLNLQAIPDEDSIP